MGADRRIWGTLAGLALAWLLGLRAEAQRGSGARLGYPAELPPATFPTKSNPQPGASPAPPKTAPAPLSLAELRGLAAAHHPDLAFARAKLRAAEGKFVQAGLYPNPMFGVRQDEWGRTNPIGNPGAMFTQEFVTAGKLKIAQAAASWGIQAADWQVSTRWFEVLTRVRLAYFDVLTAQREVQTLQKIAKVSNDVVDIAIRFEKVGVGTRPDVLRAKVELDQNEIKLNTAQRRLEATRKLLATAVGVPELPAGELAGTLEGAAPRINVLGLQALVLMRSSEIQEALARLHEAEELWRLAWAQRIPNVTFNITPFYAGEPREARLALNLVAPVPLFNRNQGNIIAAQADAARIAAEVKQTELRLTERVTLAFQRYQVAYEQAEAYQKRIIPNADRARELIEFGYSKGDPKYNYTTVLQAQQVQFQAELAYVQVVGELWRALSELTGVAQEEELLGSGPPAEPRP